MSSATAAETSQTRGALESLEIQNFRVFRRLVIERLGHVDLIVGKNSIGKSALLEALRLYAEQGSPAVITQLLSARREWTPRRVATERDNGAGLVPVTLLFHGRPTVEQQRTPIGIGPAGLNVRR